VTVFIDHHAVGRVLTFRDCVALLEEVSRHEAQGETFASPRSHSDFRGGAMRILFAADHAHGVGATKTYHAIQDVGTRYLVSLIDLRSGALLALIDGRHITDFRTGGASGLVARRMAFGRPVSVGVVGSGRQARAQLECLAERLSYRPRERVQPNAEKSRGVRPRDERKAARRRRARGERRSRDARA
jgi:alanine dehydrogenase